MQGQDQANPQIYPHCSVCLQPACICLSPPSTSASVLTSPSLYCRSVSSLPTTFLSDYCISSHLLASCLCPFGLTTFLQAFLSLLQCASVCLLLLPTSKSITFEPIKHSYTCTHLHTLSHTLSNGSFTLN